MVRRGVESISVDSGLNIKKRQGGDSGPGLAVMPFWSHS